jgi:(S)-2-hydroxy-acid oxidase
MKRILRRSFSRRAALSGLSGMGGLAALPFLSRAMADEPVTVASAFTKPRAAVTSAEQALSVMDFEALARDALPPAHFGYIASGSDDDRTVLRNHEAFSHFEIRARRFNDVRTVSLATKVFGAAWPSPVYLSAVSAMRAFHPDAELGVARAARSRATQMMLSSGASSATEEVAAARGAPIWQQLYATDDWSVTEKLVQRAEKAGCTAIALTVDSPGARNLETLKRLTQVDSRNCADCHTPDSRLIWKRAPLYAGIDVSHVTAIAPANISPAYLAKLRSIVKGRLLIKGIVTGEDAEIAVKNGADGIVVSNHGGRNEETLRATVDCLAEVISATRKRVPVFLDGGVRRGTDVFKALALGAAGVGIGRPQAWGLAAFGQQGVEAVLNILDTELTNIMRQAGTATIASITAAQLVRTQAG